MIRNAHVVASPMHAKHKAGETAIDVARRAAADMERCLQERAGKIAAVILEPLVQCATGFALCMIPNIYA